jgi:hypothetical protein
MSLSPEFQKKSDKELNMLTDKQIEDAAKPFIRDCGGYSAYEEAIPYRNIEDFARAIEKAVLDEIKKMNGASRS